MCTFQMRKCKEREREGEGEGEGEGEREGEREGGERWREREATTHGTQLHSANTILVCGWYNVHTILIYTVSVGYNVYLSLHKHGYGVNYL